MEDKTSNSLLQSFLARTINSRTLRLTIFANERRKAETLVDYLNKLIAIELSALSEDEKLLSSSLKDEGQ